MLRTTRPTAVWLIAALAVALIARLPGVAWGVNWPDGFTLHHPDEYTHVANADAIISPLGPRGGVAYPKAMAACAAAPYLLWYAAHGQFGGERIHIPWTVGAGRLVSVIFAGIAILLVSAIGRDALGDVRAGLYAPWLLALGGLHVTQSHFFLADVAATTWLLLTSWLLWRDLTLSGQMITSRSGGRPLLPRPPWLSKVLRLRPACGGVRRAHSPTPRSAPELRGDLRRGGAVRVLARFRYSTLALPGSDDRHRQPSGIQPHPRRADLSRSISRDLFAAAAARHRRNCGLVHRVMAANPVRRRHVLLVFGSVPLIGIAFVLINLDNFSRHWVWLIPWSALAGGR